MREHIGGEMLSIVRQLVLELHPKRDRVEVGLDSALDRDLGIDSLGRVELLTRIEKAFDTSLPEDTFAVIGTPRDLLKVLTRERGEPTSVKFSDRLPDAGEREARVWLPTRAETLIEVLHWHARYHPDRVHIRFYTDRDDGEAITYGQLMTEALAVGNGLTSDPGQTPLEFLSLVKMYGRYSTRSLL